METDEFSEPENDLDDYFSDADPNELMYGEVNKISEEDMAALSLFMPSGPSTRKTLAEIIMEKLADSQNTDVSSNEPHEQHPGLNPKVVQVYEQ